MNRIYESSKLKVTVLKEGYCRLIKPVGDDAGGSRFHADGSITLVETKGHKVLVDTGGPWDRQYLIDAFADLGVGLDEIDHVIGTHGHSDHIGNLNLFPDATQIVGWDVCKRDLYTLHPFSEGKPYLITPELVVMPTPGHTHHDVSLCVHDGGKTIVIAGDLFESENDISDPSLWRDCSEDPQTQKVNRRKILDMADIIVPGHGPAFQVRDIHRTKLMAK
ncbi:metallo-beta-lactamase domain-containing protein 1 [Strongylocentrotus purpuratus]|uniref:Metallo-beta-lactamase domain-containing protein 1 n=1 Tax=Strongylocentrotus purpuratus TaxID=7668 RepID=A0A7M7HQW8_STRPU|nr:metallo-beta-lactamase domain-containing protein 1 [Strongylocentrotus purpuratus]